MAVDLDFERKLHRDMQPAPAGSLFETFADKAARRVDDVLWNRECRWPLDEEGKMLLRCLRLHQGRNRSVHLAALVTRTGLSERQVKDVVRDLRLNFNVAICSSRSGDGYWLAETFEDVLDTVKPYYAQALSELRLVYAMRRNAESMDQFLTQLALDLEHEEGGRRG